MWRFDWLIEITGTCHPFNCRGGFSLHVSTETRDEFQILLRSNAKKDLWGVHSGERKSNSTATVWKNYRIIKEGEMSLAQLWSYWCCKETPTDRVHCDLVTSITARQIANFFIMYLWRKKLERWVEGRVLVAVWAPALNLVSRTIRWCEIVMIWDEDYFRLSSLFKVWIRHMPRTGKIFQTFVDVSVNWGIV